MAKKGGNPQNLKPFQKGQTGNPKGRPKQTINLVNEKLRQEGYTPATNIDIQNALLTLINLPMERIVQIEKDSETPALYKIAAKELQGARASDFLEKALDRSIGKAKQSVEHSGGVSVRNARDLSDEELERIIAEG